MVSNDGHSSHSSTMEMSRVRRQVDRWTHDTSGSCQAGDGLVSIYVPVEDVANISMINGQANHSGTMFNCVVSFLEGFAARVLTLRSYLR